MRLVQYKRTILCRLKNVQTHVRMHPSAVQRSYKSDLDRTVGFRLVINARDFMFDNRPPQTLTETKRLETGPLHEDTSNDSPKLLPMPEGSFCARSATDMFVCNVFDGVTTKVSTECITKVPTDLRALQ